MLTQHMQAQVSLIESQVFTLSVLTIVSGSSVQSSAVNQTLTTVSKSCWGGTWRTRLGAATVPEWLVVNKLNRVLTKPG